MTEEEHQAFLDRCTKASLASWIREICLNEKKTKQSRVVEVNPQLLRQLAGIGNNLNQIAKIVNQKAKTNTPFRPHCCDYSVTRYRARAKENP